MTHRKKSNVCPVCGAQGKMICSSKNGVWFSGEFWALGKRKKPVYLVVCDCTPECWVSGATKRLAWRCFKTRRIEHMRLYKNYARHCEVDNRTEIKMQSVSANNAHR